MNPGDTPRREQNQGKPIRIGEEGWNARVRQGR